MLICYWLIYKNVKMYMHNGWHPLAIWKSMQLHCIAEIRQKFCSMKILIALIASTTLNKNSVHIEMPFSMCTAIYWNIEIWWVCANFNILSFFLNVCALVCIQLPLKNRHFWQAIVKQNRMNVWYFGIC